MPEIPQLEQLLKKGVHFGHKESKWHPNMEPYIYTCRNGVHIIDLAQTQEALSKALEFIKQTVKDSKIILFVGTKKAIKDIIKKYAQKAEMPYVNERWLGGTITNFKTINGLVKSLEEIQDKQKDSDYEEKYTKKERLEFNEEKSRLEKMIGGIREMENLPAVIFITDLRTEKTAVKEAKRKKIPIVAIADTNVDPSGIDYLIPANDDSIKSVELIVKLVAEAVEEGREDAKKGEKKEVTAPNS